MVSRGLCFRFPKDFRLRLVYASRLRQLLVQSRNTLKARSVLVRVRPLSKQDIAFLADFVVNHVVFRKNP